MKVVQHNICLSLVRRVIAYIKGSSSASTVSFTKLKQLTNYTQAPLNIDMSPKTLSLAVCVFPEVCPTDYQGPVELLSFISPGTIARGLFPHTPAVTIEATYVGTTLEPLIPGSGPRILADKTYDDVKEQFDIILVPGGLSHKILVQVKYLSS